MKRYLMTAFGARLAEEGMAVALVLLAMQRTGSAAHGALLLTMWMAPHAVAAPLTGAVAARMRRPRLFYCSALTGFALAIGGLALTVGRAPTGLTLAIALLGGSCGPVVSGGLSSLVAVLAPDDTGRARAYALDAAVYNAASVTGPAVVSLLAGISSPATSTLALAVIAAGSATLTTVLPLHRTPEPHTTDSLPPLKSVANGGAAMWRVPELRAITVATSLAFVGVGGLTTTAVLLAERHGQPEAGGVLMTVFAVGALAGSLLLARRKPAFPPQRLVTYSLAGTGLTLIAAAALPSFTASALLFAAAGLFDGPLLSATLRIRADHAPPSVRTQVFTLGAGLKISAAACGAALTGAATALPAPVLLLIIAALQLCAAAAYIVMRARARVTPRSIVPGGPTPRAVGGWGRSE
ncbi:MFS transporter [Streptomyces ochraceiscleroticus]|uniref:MFS transporter n=1 Tax=Streptomyces ochraceiscleroticus TaxID=47761 RepID=A0ABW1MK77_9ACTN|nr:MFS transporter [Streptomyces ochraceiscleroticus]